jgi:threonine/homoserine/homoserine lactone efflux protein
VDARFLAFITVSALLIMAPGPDMALVARNALRSGWNAAWPTALGVGAGILGWGIAAVLGIASLLAESAAAFTAVKLAGAAYLLYLGLHSLRAGLAKVDDSAKVPASSPSPRRRSAFLQGLLGNLLNPKAAVIFVAIIPQFIRHGDSPLRLAFMLLAFEAMIVVWLTLYGYLLSRAGQSRFGLRVRRALQTVSGLALMGFAIRLAAESREL